MTGDCARTVRGSMTFLETTAAFNPARTHRYSLTRVWDRALPRILWVMLNPSTADEDTLDPTIRRCVGFSKAWGFGTLEVVNLFSLRGTDPRCLHGVHSRKALGADFTNDAAILSGACHASCIIAGWGAHGTLYGRGLEVRLLLGRRGHLLHCLGRTAAGQPKHPLYLAASTRREVL